MKTDNKTLPNSGELTGTDEHEQLINKCENLKAVLHQFCVCNIDAYPKGIPQEGVLCGKKKFHTKRYHRKTDVVVLLSRATQGPMGFLLRQEPSCSMCHWILMLQKKRNSTLHSGTGVKCFTNIHTNLTSKMPVNDSELPAHHPKRIANGPVKHI